MRRKSNIALVRGFCLASFAALAAPICPLALAENFSAPKNVLLTRMPFAARTNSFFAPMFNCERSMSCMSLRIAFVSVVRLGFVYSRRADCTFPESALIAFSLASARSFCFSVRASCFSRSIMLTKSSSGIARIAATSSSVIPSLPSSEFNALDMAWNSLST